jgi:DNA-nicking Smr family endonuclease
MSQAIVEIDVHGMNKYQAKVYIDSQIKRAGSGVYRIRVIHGYRGGTELKEMIRKEYSRKHPKVIRLEIGLNQGETDLVLREL